MILANNTDTSSPPLTDTFSLSIGARTAERNFLPLQVDPGFPLAVELELTLKAGETIQATPTTITLVLNALVEGPAMRARDDRRF